MGTNNKGGYSFMIVTLLGQNINDLHKASKPFTSSTITRIGIQMLFGLKEIHDCGYIHRDIKPQNAAIGRKLGSVKIIHILDFGLAREFIIVLANKVAVRKPRIDVLFRGTLRYCSIASHQKLDQGRHDDIWSLVYVLAEFIQPLPWDSFSNDKKMIELSKTQTKDAELFPGYPQFLDLSAYLRTLDYMTRPDYGKCFTIFESLMTAANAKMSDPFDWETSGHIKATPSEGNTKGSATSNNIAMGVKPTRNLCLGRSALDMAELDKTYTIEAFNKTEVSF